MCDKHIVKMPLETAQMMWAALHRHDEKLIELKPEEGPLSEVFYGATHKHHPCTIWCGDSRDNFLWLYKHGLALCKEYSLRYHKKHKSYKAIKLAYSYREKIPEGGITDFAQAMPVEYKVVGNPVKAYRDYYMGEKRPFATWRFETPHWWR